MNENYLPEDQDLIDELNAIQPMNPNQIYNTRQEQLAKLQIQSILRNRKSLADMDRSNTRFSRAFTALGVAQFVIAFSQLGFDIINSAHRLWGMVIFLLLASFLFFVFSFLKA